MKKKILLMLSMLTIVSSHSYAKVVSFKQEAMNRRFVKVAYKNDVVYEIYGQPFMATAIVFDPTEEIKNYSLSDPAWTGIINEHQMYVKAPSQEYDVDGNLILPPESTLFISTSKRNYYFKLKVTNSGAYNPVIEFVYPDDQIKLIENFKFENQIRETRRTGLKATNIETLNFNYKWNKKYDWSPRIVMDDGEKTTIYLSIKDKDIPVLFVKKDGELEKVEFFVKDTVDGNKQIVINQIFKEGVLMLGTKKITIVNKNN